MGFRQFTISQDQAALDALAAINELKGASLFVVDGNGRVVGSLTDGDIRRGLLAGKVIGDSVTKYMNVDFRWLKAGDIQRESVKAYKEAGLRHIPVLDDDKRLVDVWDLRLYQTVLPLDAVIMAGGRGARLMPLTESLPKPMLPVGGKPILERNIDRLASFGVKRFHLTLNYLGEKIHEYFGDGSQKGLDIRYVAETEPLGTIGAVGLINDFKHADVLLMNSDLLTAIDYEEFYEAFLAAEADMAVATVPYHIDVPYAVMEVGADNQVGSLKEKPRYTYFCNAGIYLLKREVAESIEPKRTDATDTIELLIESGRKVISYPIRGYWLDIGKMDDYRRAQQDIKLLKL